jgi:adenylate cyclase
VGAFKLLNTTGDQALDITPGRTYVVGRAVICDVPVYDPTVSRRHAELTLAADGVRVQDLGSSNGTFVNGTRIASTVAGNGDVISFGKVAYSVLETTPPQPRPAPQDSGAFVVPPPEATIVKQVVVSEPPALEERVARRSGTRLAEEIPVDERQAQKLALLLDISKELSKQQDVDLLLEKVVDITFKVMNVDRVSILMLEGSSEELIPRISRNRLDDTGGARVPRSIARRAVEERLAILTDNAAADERFKGKSIVMQSVRSAMCTPLMGSDGKVLGILYVDNMTATNSFGDEDLEFLIAFSGIAAVAIENSRLTDRIRREAVVLQLGGAKRSVVVFFSDIRGFTSISETMNPDEIASLLTEYFTEMVEVVFEHGGTLDKFMGDAIMALWGAPIPDEHAADRAMRAAIEQQEMLEALNEKWALEGRQQVQIGIGINFGEVFAGNIGSERRLEYTVIGDAVNTASRLCSQAGPGEILVSEPFYRSLEHPPAVEALEPLQLKGKARAVPVYRVKR